MKHISYKNTIKSQKGIRNMERETGEDNTNYREKRVTW